MSNKLPIKVFDFFSGCGGTSKGFLDSGMDVVFALDNDPEAANTYKSNLPGVYFLESNIVDIKEEILIPIIKKYQGSPLLFSGCAPCQPFTKQNTKRSTDQKQIFLLSEFQRFVKYFRPEYVFVENVPGLQRVENRDGPFSDFVETLSSLGYFLKYNVIASQDYGVPQRRRRFVLIASRLGPIDFPKKTHGIGTHNPDYSTVFEWIGDFPSIKAGELHLNIPNHRAANLSEINLTRIQSTPHGGSRLDWPSELKLSCHSSGYEGHTDVYGRLRWNEPATGLTTRCISLSNGRFGHPEQDRAISVREAASLQTFPRDYIFYGSLSSMARQIGNAVPVLLAKRFGENFNQHLTKFIPLEKNGNI